MNKTKLFLFYLLSIFIFVFGILIIDIILSNTLLKQNHCINYQEFFYELKKNVKVNIDSNLRSLSQRLIQI